MKKLIALLLVLLGMLLLAACGEAPHTHAPTSTVRENEVAATCTTEGSYDEVVKCAECGEELSRTAKTVEKTAHTLTTVRENEIAETCIAGGSYEEVIRCSVCEEEFSRETKIAHTLATVKENEIAATCTTEGSYEEVVKCSVCGEEISRTAKKSEKTAHTIATVKENEVAATCMTEGSYEEVIRCSVCEEELSRETKIAPVVEHDVDMNRVCTYCHEVIPSEGLVFVSNGDDTCYVAGIGECGDRTVVIPSLSPAGERVTGIGDGAFENCNAVKSFVLPDTVTYIGSRAFLLCRALESVEIGKNVRSIGDYAFYWNERLSSVYLPDSVTMLGEGAFEGCAALEEARLSRSLRSIESTTFYETGLKTLVIPDSVTSIDFLAFSCCVRLRVVVFGTGLKYVDSSAFSGCSRLVEAYNRSSLSVSNAPTETGVHLEKVVHVYTDLAQTPETAPAPTAEFFFRETNGEIYLIAYLGEDLDVTLPSSYNDRPYAIGDSAFYMSGIRSVQIPEGVTAIGQAAFFSCSELTQIHLPDSIRSIGACAFDGCKNLIEITLGCNLTEIGSRAFDNVNQLIVVCNLSSLPIEPGSTGYGGIAENAIRVYTEKTTWSVQTDADGFVFLTDDLGSVLIKYTGKQAELTLPQTFNGEAYGIAANAFREQQGLRKVTIPNIVTQIGMGAFQNCGALESVILPSGLTHLPDRLFCDCYRLFDVHLPEGLISIGREAFSGCKALREIVLPSGVSSLGEYAFCSSGLKEIALPNALVEVPAYAFYMCSSLGDVIFGDALVRIGEEAFCHTELSRVILPHGLTEIGTNAFYECEKLYIVCNLSALEIVAGEESHGHVAACAVHVSTSAELAPEIYTSDDGFVFLLTSEICALIEAPFNVSHLVLPSDCRGRSYVIAKNLFYDTQELESVVIPDGAVTEIGNGAFCRSELKSITLGIGITRIGKEAFKSCRNLRSVSLPETVEIIDESAFANSALTSVIIPAKVKVIGAAAFYGCDALTSVALSEGLVEIGEVAFSDSSLTELHLPSTLEIIGMGAFAGCGFRSVTIPAAVRSIGRCAFSYCENMTSVEFEQTEGWSVKGAALSATYLSDAAQVAADLAAQSIWTIDPETVWIRQ